MKKLTLIRHAKSSWEFPELMDYDRPLNSRGLKNAPEMGNRIAAKGIKPDLIVSSPALRAITTAGLIADRLGYAAERIVEIDQIYDAWLDDLVKVIHQVADDIHHLFLIGHNPGLLDLAKHFSHFEVLKFPTCAVVQIEFNTTKWKNLVGKSGTVNFYDYPKSKQV